jgi:hypothetical protein
MKRKCRAKNPSACRVHGETGEYVFTSTSLDYNTHTRESEKLKLFLNKYEVAAVTDYLDQSYMEMNAHLHGADLTPSADTLERIKQLDSALKKYEEIAPAETVITYRATKCYQDFRSKEEAEEWVKQQFPVKGRVKLAGFTSTTPNPDALFDFLPESHADLQPPIGTSMFPTQADWEEYLADEPDRGLGNLVFVMKTRPGAPVSNYGQTFSEKEQEYLHPRDKEFVVEQVLPHRRISNPSKTARRSSAHATIVTLVESR